MRLPSTSAWLLLTAPLLWPACAPPSPGPSTSATAAPVYNAKSGRLEQLLSDHNGDGRVDTRAFMDGRRLDRIEIDRNGDGRTDRWEHYIESAGSGDPSSPARAEVARVDEANGADERITRREFYESGELVRVEDDSNLDGRVDRWEHYQAGFLARLDVDLGGRGFPDRRLIYIRDGSIQRIEVDPSGSGIWRDESSPTSRD